MNESDDLLGMENDDGEGKQWKTRW